MRIIGIAAFSEPLLPEVTQMEQSLRYMGYPVHVEQMGYNVETAHIGDYYYEETALLLWLCRCYNDHNRCRQAIERFVDEEVDMIVAMTAPALDIAIEICSHTDVPIVFTHTVYPLVNGSSSSNSKNYRNITGVRDICLDVVEERLSLATEVVPAPTTIHAFYNPEIEVSKLEMKYLRKAARRMHIDSHLHPVQNAVEAKEILGEITLRDTHALLRLSDPTIAPLSGLFGAVAFEKYIPYIGSNLDELQRCNALFALEISGVGKQAAIILKKILEGISPADIPPLEPAEKKLGLNLQAAKDLGFVISPAIQKQAQIIVPASQQSSLGMKQLIGLSVSTVTITIITAIASRLGSGYLISLTLLLALGLSFSLWFIIQRFILHPIKRFSIIADKIGAGDMDNYIGNPRAENEIAVLARALRRMKSNISNSSLELEKITTSLENRVKELTDAYRQLKKTKHDLELANRRIIEYEDNSRFALTTYIHDEILGIVDELVLYGRKKGQSTILNLAVTMDQKIKRLRYDLSVPILKQIEIELKKLIVEELPHIYPTSSDINTSIELSEMKTVSPLPPGSIVLLYRFVRGAVGNAYRHSNADQVNVIAHRNNDSLSLTVSDNGKGFALSHIERSIRSGHYFFHDIRIRAHQIGGSFTVISSHGKGAVLTVTIPLTVYAQ